MSGLLFPLPPAGLIPPGRKHDPLFEAVADQTCPGWRQGLTSSARGALCRAVKELKSIGVLPDEVTVLASAYRKDMPGASLTASALAKHAPRLRRPQVRESRGYDVARCMGCGRLERECSC